MCEPPSKGRTPGRASVGARLPGSLSRGPSHAALGSEGPGARQPRVHELKPPRSLCARDSSRGASAAAGGPPQPLAPGQGPPASRRCGTPRGLLRERGAFLCAFPSQVCSEARSGARRCRLALEGGGGRAPEQGRVAPLPGGFLFAALPRITSKERHGWRRQRVLFCDAFKESARLLVSMASFLVALHRRVAPRACAGGRTGGRARGRAPAVSCGGGCVSARRACRSAAEAYQLGLRDSALFLCPGQFAGLETGLLPADRLFRIY